MGGDRLTVAATRSLEWRHGDLYTNEMDDVDERPAFLGRIRPVAKIVFTLVILWVLAGVVQGLWEVITDIRERISGR